MIGKLKHRSETNNMVKNIPLKRLALYYRFTILLTCIQKHITNNVNKKSVVYSLCVYSLNVLTICYFY